MLDKILRTLKAKGEAYEVLDKSRDKSRDKALRIIREQPDITQAELALYEFFSLVTYCNM